LDSERAKRLQGQFRTDHERLARRHLSPAHAAVLLAPAADVSPAPLDRDMLFKRMIVLFDDPALAHLAVEKAGQCPEQLEGAKHLLPKERSKVERILERQERENRKRVHLETMSPAKREKVAARKARKLARKHGYAS
jgi:hypothetical protein